MLGRKRRVLNRDRNVALDQISRQPDLRISKFCADGQICILKVENAFRRGAIACKGFESYWSCLRKWS